MRPSPDRTRPVYDCDPDPHAVERLVGLSVAAVERELLVATLALTGGNRTHAAQILGISIRTLRNKLHGIQREGD